MSISKQIEVLKSWNSELQPQIEKFDEMARDLENRELELWVKRLIAGYVTRDDDSEIDKSYFKEKFAYPLEDEERNLKKEKEDFDSEDNKKEVECIRALIKQIDESIIKWEKDIANEGQIQD